MAAIKFSPYIPNVEAWVEFYKHQPNENRTFYTIGKAKQKGEELDAIKLITPTESVIEQAKSSLKREREIEDTFPIAKKSRQSKKKPPRRVEKSSAQRERR